MVNYNTTHSKATHKYFFKVFCNKTNRKEYDLQIWQYDIRHTNIIVIKDMIIWEMTRKKKRLSKSIADTIVAAEIAQTLSYVDLAKKYIWAISNANLDAAKKLGPTGIKK